MHVVCATRYEVVEERRWRVPESPLVHLFVDARGVPARCAAVLFIDGDCLYTDGMPSASIMQTFTQRADNQIMTLEILAISVGLSTFAEELKGRKVIVYSDNTGAEVNVALSIRFLNPPVFVVSLQAASRKGRASSWDHCGLIHEIWSFCLINQTYLWIERVPSASNISDLPSREDYKLLQDMDPPAVWRQGSQFGYPFPQYLLRVFWRVEAAYRSDALC